MSIEAISAIKSLDTTETLSLTKAQPSFDSWLSQQVSQVDSNIKVAEHQAQQLAVGETENLHQVMIAISKAQTSFDFMVQVRNRLVESTQELLRMSI